MSSVPPLGQAQHHHELLRGDVEACSVFLSHAGEQKDFVYLLRKSLRDIWPQLNIFLDEKSIQLAGDVWDQIECRLAQANIVVLVLSREFLVKPSPMAELFLVMERHRQVSSCFGPVQLVPVLKGNGFTFEELKAERKRYEEEGRQLQLGAQVTAQQKRFQAFAASQSITLHALFEQFAHDLKDLMKIAAILNDQADKLCQLVVETVTSCLARAGLQKIKLLHTFVALDEASVDGLVDALSCGSEQQAVLLTGTAGMGKSVLARQAYETLVQEYPHVLHCFVDLRNMAWLDELSTAQLQQQLLDQLGVGGVVTAVHNGIAALKRHLQGKQVIMLLDNAAPTALDAVLPDMDGPGGTFLGLLGQGSMVLVTSRAGELLPGFGSYVSVQKQPMPDSLALQLFHHHAQLGRECAQADPEQQQKAIQALLRHCGGCPLAIAVVGKYVRNSGNWRAHLKSCNPDVGELVTEAMLNDMPERGSSLAQLEQSCRNRSASKEGWQPVDMEAMLKDIAFFFSEHDPALKLLQWCFPEEAPSRALQDLGLFSTASPPDCLNNVLIDMFKVIVGRESHRIKAEAGSLSDLCQADWRTLQGLWVHGEKECNQTVLSNISAHSQDLRLLQLACGLQDEPQLKPPSSKSLYLLGISADVVGVPHLKEAVVDFRSPSRPKLARSMVLVHSRPGLRRLELVPCKHVRALWVSCCPALEDVQLAQLEKLCKLYIMGCPQLRTVADLGGLPQLKEMWLCGCSLSAVCCQPAAGHLLESLNCLVLQPCEHCVLGACLAGGELCSLSPAAAPSRILLQQLRGLTRLELRPRRQQQQQQEQQEQQADLENVRDQATSTVQPGNSSSISDKLPTCPSARAVKGSNSAGPLAELSPLLSILQGLGVTQAETLLSSSSVHGLGQLLLQQERSSATARLELTGSSALYSMHIHSTLATLQLVHCTGLTGLYNSSPAPTTFSLRSIVLQECPQLTALPDLSAFQALTHLQLDSCPRIRSIQLGTSLQELQLHSCASLQSADWSQHALTRPELKFEPELRKLQVQDCPQLHTLQLQLLPRLRLLDLQGCSALQQVVLGTSLVRAYISSCAALTRLEAAAAGAARQQLAAAASLPAAFRLQVLRVRDCCSLEHIGGIPKLLQLAELTVGNNAKLRRYLDLSSSLRRLTVEACPELSGIQHLTSAAAATQHPALASEPQPSAECRLDQLAAVSISKCPQLQLHTEQLPHPKLCTCLLDGVEIDWEWGWYRDGTVTHALAAPDRLAGDTCNDQPGSIAAMPVVAAALEAAASAALGALSVADAVPVAMKTA